MITAIVDSHREIRVAVSVLASDGTECSVDAILDTGFNDSLTLPLSLIAELGLPWKLRETAVLANGQSEEVDVYGATILWDGEEKDILVLGLEAESLLGMEMLLGFDLRARIEVGGRVEIERNIVEV